MAFLIKYAPNLCSYLLKGKASVVPFHGITFPYNYFEEISIFVPIQQDYLVFLDHGCLESTKLKAKSLLTTSGNVFPFYTSSQNSNLKYGEADSLKPS